MLPRSAQASTMSQGLSHLLIVGAARRERLAAGDSYEAALFEDAQARVTRGPAGHLPTRITLPAAELPFIRPSKAAFSALSECGLLRIDDFDRAFPNHQLTGTRLILTQSTYLLQKWRDLLEPSGHIVATASRDALARGAPEALEGRGPWRAFKIIDLGAGHHHEIAPGLETELVPQPTMEQGDPETASSLEVALGSAFSRRSREDRFAICRLIFGRLPESAVAALTFASAAREQQDLGAARAALDTAAFLAPDWEAVHYEDGKFWLGCEDLDRARAAFERAAELMPSFSAAHVNLGATLGELGRPDDALKAFSSALREDPDNVALLNNIGVVSRELGRLEESEAALNDVVRLAPTFVFGHYNLGHTRLLGGNYRGALEAYEEGQRRDPERNRRQGCRLAVARFANGDLEGAERDLWQMAQLAPAEEREDLLLEAYEIGQALIQAHPALDAHRAFLERIAAALGSR